MFKDDAENELNQWEDIEKNGVEKYCRERIIPLCVEQKKEEEEVNIGTFCDDFEY